MFKKIDTDEALIVEGGVYKPAEVYAGPEHGLFVKAKGGFVRIKSDGSTSHTSVKVQTLARNAPLWQDKWGRLCHADGSGHRPVQLTNGGGDALALPAK